MKNDDGNDADEVASYCYQVVVFGSLSADSPSPSYPAQNLSNGASHMGSRGPAAPPGSGGTGSAGGQPRLGPTGGGSGGSSAGGGTGSGQEPTPMDMSIGPQPSQSMTTSHGIIDSLCFYLYLHSTDRTVLAMNIELFVIDPT